MGTLEAGKEGEGFTMLRNRADGTRAGRDAPGSARASEVPVSGVRPVDRGAHGGSVSRPPSQPPPPSPPPYEEREPLDSLDQTSVKLPSPVLLTIARGEHRSRPPRRTTWFALGLAAGATAAWLATGDVRARVGTARAWTSSVAIVVQHAMARETTPAPPTPPE
jgi:hypothetical protein